MSYRLLTEPWNDSCGNMIQISLEMSLNFCTRLTKKKLYVRVTKVLEFLESYSDRQNLLTNETNMLDDVEEPTVEMPQRSLKTSRKVAKVSVTRKMNEIAILMCAVENVNVVIAVESELDKAMENFYRAHDDYDRSLTSVEAQEESVSYFTEHVTKYLYFKERIDLFRQRCERISVPAYDRVQPSDSISQTCRRCVKGVFIPHRQVLLLVAPESRVALDRRRRALC